MRGLRFAAPKVNGQLRYDAPTEGADVNRSLYGSEVSDARVSHAAVS
jgi:hypothetical protein